MGWRDVRKSVKKWRMNVGGRDESPSTPTLTQPSDSEQGDVQLSTEASGDTPQAQASTRPVADAQAIPSSMVADAIVTRPPATAPVEPRAEAPPATESPEQQTHALSTSQRLWNAAYDLLEDDKDTAQLVTAYVKTLVKVLGAEPETTGADITTELEDPLRRQLFMKKLVEEGQSKINKASKITRRVGEFAKAVLSLKPLVDMAVSIPYAAPAALPWAGVCAGLHILSNPAEAAKSNLAGITHVLSRMEWYDAVAEHLLNKDGIEMSDWNFQAVLPQLEEKVVALFKALLLYQMKSVCSYYRHQGYVFLRGLAFQDDWGADLKIVTDAEETLKRDSDQYSTLHTTTTMGQLVERAKGIEGSLGDIHQTLQDFITQQKAIRRDNMEAACRRDLRVVDPQHDMERIERNKDELVDGAYKWILGTDEYASFINWYDGGPDSSRCRLLWINGHAGTGKTMLMIGIIRELSRKSAILAPKLSFFFCQGTDATLNNATAILRSLIWLLIIQQPCLCSHLLPRYEESGADLFKDRNAFYALSEVFRNMLEDPDLSPVYFAVDALDECEHGLADLIKLISTSMALSDKVKWIVSSRPTVELKTPGTAGSLVELDAQRLEEPVNAYIMHKLSALATRDGYDDGVLAKVADEVRGRAQNTFLWVALVFNELDAEDENHNPVHGEYALEIIGEIPPGLSKIYNHIMTRIEKGIRRDPEYCKNALVAAVLAYRPLTLSELAALAGLPPNMLPQTVARKCGSFLTVREETVYLIHQSAKDYLEENFESTLQPAGFAQGHADIGRRCIEAMSSILRRNIYNLDYGFKPKDMNPRHPDPLAPVRYACVFWADHLCFQNGGTPECRKALADDEVVFLFLKKRFLHWLESLSLLGKLSEGVLSIKKLLYVVQKWGTSPRLTTFLEDAEKFVRSHASIIERAPLQTYGSALIFSPLASEVRNSQWEERLSFVKTVMGIRDYWDAFRQILEGHSNSVTAVAFSPDGNTLASASEDQSIRLWDAATTGTCRQTLKGHSSWVMAIAFSPDGKTLASGSRDKSIRLWDAATGTYACRQTLEGHSDSVTAVAFSPDGKMLASASYDHSIRLWDAAAGIYEYRQTLKGHSRPVMGIAFSPDGKTLASGSRDQSIRLWDAAGTYEYRETLEGHGDSVTAVAFSPDGKTLASGSRDKSIRLWDAATGTYACRQTLEGHSRWVMAVAFSPDGKTLASGSRDRSIQLWDAATQTCRQTLERHSDMVNAIGFSPDGKTLASASSDRRIRLWDAATGTHEYHQTHKGHSLWVRAVTFSPDGKTLASGSQDQSIRLWDAATGTCRQTLEGHSDMINAIDFSPDGKTLASASSDRTIRLWDAATGIYRQSLKGHGELVNAIAFSPDSKTLASASYDQSIRLWDAATGKYKYRRTLRGHNRSVGAVAFSPDGNTLASGSDDYNIRLWDAAMGTYCLTLEGHRDAVTGVAFSPDGKTLASGSRDKSIRLWDVATGTCRQTLEGHSCWVSTIALPAEGKMLLQLLSISASPDQYPNKHPSDHALYVGYKWIALDGENFLWLPSDYRASVVALDGNRLVLGHHSGGLTFLHFEFS